MSSENKNNIEKYITWKETLYKNKDKSKLFDAISKADSFCYYTKNATFKSICNTDTENDKAHYFWVSNLESMNDKDEANLHSNDKERVFALCFCNTKREGIPMWYMYSGIEGKGNRIRFTAGTMKKFISSINVVHPIIGNDNMKVDNSTEYILGKDFEIEYDWIYYIDTKKGKNTRTEYSKNDVFYRNKKYALTDEQVDFAESYFVKKYPWNYEHEFRIVFIFKTKPECSGKIAVEINDSIWSSLFYMFGPESDTTSQSTNNQEKENIKFEGKSTLTIEMKLGKNN